MSLSRASTILAFAFIVVVASGLILSASYVQNVETTRVISDTRKIAEDEVSVSWDLAIPGAIYQGVSHKADFSLTLDFKNGPFNVTLDYIEISIYAKGSCIASSQMIDYAHSQEGNCRQVVRQGIVVLTPSASADATEFMCLVAFEASNATWSLGADIQHDVEAGPVFGVTLQPPLWFLSAIVLAVALPLNLRRESHMATPVSL